MEPIAHSPVQSPPYDVAALRREEFPWADQTIFVNHASIGPIPERARRGLAAFHEARAAAHTLGDDHLLGVLAESRAVAARLIGARPAEIALATNTSYGLNVAAQSLPLVAGDVVLASHGEFPANVFPWRHLARRGVRLELVPVTPDGWPDEAALIERMADPAVKVLAISLVQFHTGYLADMAALSAAASATGTWLVVDAIQGLGQVPFDVRETPVDILACGGQKWLLSPWGSGFTYIRPELIERLEPPFAGWTAFEGTDDYESLTHYRGNWHPDARRFELITLPFQDFFGMNLAIGLLLELGIDAVRRHLVDVNAPVLDWAGRRGVRLASPVGASGSGIVALVPPEPRRVYERLAGQGVVASFREGAVRISAHCYTTVEEMERLTGILDRAVP